MEIKANNLGSADINTYITSAYKCLLADEYIVMNKISCCLMDPATPFLKEHADFFQTIYEELKQTTETISSAIKQRSSYTSISINDIVTCSTIKNNVNFAGRVGMIEILVTDNDSIISRLNEVITDVTIYGETEVIEALKNIRNTHSSFNTRLNLFLKQIISGKEILHDKEPG